MLSLDHAQILSHAAGSPCPSIGIQLAWCKMESLPHSTSSLKRLWYCLSRTITTKHGTLLKGFICSPCLKTGTFKTWSFPSVKLPSRLVLIHVLHRRTQAPRLIILFYIDVIVIILSRIENLGGKMSIARRAIRIPCMTTCMRHMRAFTTIINNKSKQDTSPRSVL